MFLRDSNKEHNPKRYKYKPLNTTPFGKSNKAGTGAEFKAPPNSAVNRIELFHNGAKIICIKFYCADVTTGEPVMVQDPSTNKMRKHAVIGKKISRADEIINYENVESSGIVFNGKYYPSFISEVSSIFDSSKGINILGFHRSSILQDGFEINEKCAS